WRTTVTPGQVLKLTQAGPVTPPEPEPEPEPETVERHHTVSSGESLSAIAGGYGVARAWVLCATGLSSGSTLAPGQVVVVPRGAPATPPPVAAPAPATAGGSSAPPPPPASEGAVVPLTDEMRTNARVIIQVGRDLGVPDYGIVIALATAAQESTLRNLDWGD